PGPRARPDPDRARSDWRRGGAHGPGEPAGAEGAVTDRGARPGTSARRAAPGRAAQRPAVGLRAVESLAARSAGPRVPPRHERAESGRDRPGAGALRGG